MPKQKTRKAVAKRFKKTGTGKYMKKSPGTGHLFTSKTRKQKRRLRSSSLVSKADQQRVAKALHG